MARMKAEQRHKLETNVLADRLGKFVHTLKEGPSKSTWIVGGVIAGVVVLWFIWKYFAAQSDENNSKRWLVTMRILDGESVTGPIDQSTPPPSTEMELEKLAKDNEGTVQARVARFYLARMALAQGEKSIGSNREVAVEKIRKSAELYKKLQSESTDVPILHQEALLREAKAREMLGEFKAASDNYKLLIKDHPDSAFQKEAEAGVERLKDGSDSRKELEALADRLKAKSP
jgi:hypothetical protein